MAKYPEMAIEAKGESGLELLHAIFYIAPWNVEKLGDQEIDEILQELEVYLKKVGQHLSLDIRDEEGVLL